MLFHILISDNYTIDVILSLQLRHLLNKVIKPYTLCCLGKLKYVSGVASQKGKT